MKTKAVIDQFYADLFLSIARGMVTRPRDLEAGVSEMPQPEENGLPRYFVQAQCHAQDHGILIGGQSKNVRAFKTLLRAAATKRGQFCDLIIDEPFGQKGPMAPTPLDPKWDSDDEVADLVCQVAEDCWSGITAAIPRSEGGITTIRILHEDGIPEEEFEALKTLMKAYGRGVGRSIVLEMTK